MPAAVAARQFMTRTRGPVQRIGPLRTFGPPPRSLEALEVRGPEDFEAAFSTAKQRNAQALLGRRLLAAKAVILDL